MRDFGFNVALFLLALSGTASACSFPPGFDYFRLDSTELPFSGDAPPPAEISVRAVLRGTDGGDGASCTDAGQLILEVSESTEAERLGYIFEFEAGGFPSLSAPDSYLVPVTLEDETIGFRFIWLDIMPGSRKLRPVEIVVKVTTVSKTGVEGSPVTLRGQHPGGKLPANHALHQTLDPARLALPLQAACVKCR